MTATIYHFPEPANDPGMRIVDERYRGTWTGPKDEAWERHKHAHKRFLDTPCMATMEAKITRYAELLDHLHELDAPKRRRLIAVQRANCLAFMRERWGAMDGGVA